MFKCILFILAISLSAYSKEKPTVTVTVAPYAYAVSKITKDFCNVHILIPEESNPHLYEIKPQDVKKIATSSLWFYCGESIEAKLLDKAQISKINLNAHVKLHHECHCAHHTHAEDTHTWMSPKIYLSQAEIILKNLIEKFPEQQFEFEENFKNLKTELDQLIKQVESKGIAKDLIVTHGAYHYLCQDLSLKQITLEHEGKEASIKRIQKIFDQCKANPPKYIFAPKQHDDAGAKRLSHLLSSKVAYVNPYQKDYPKALQEVLDYLYE